MDDTRAGIYLRISHVKRKEDGKVETLGVERQEPPCRALVQARGGTVVDVYVDNDTSAWSGAPREEYGRMMDDLRSGRINTVVAWQADRLIRRMKDAIPLLDTVRNANGQLWTVAGDYDLSTAAGRSNFRNAASQAELSSDLTSERLILAYDQLAQSGAPKLGPRHFGYERDGITVNEEEAALIREAARRLLGGEQTATILRDWRARDIVTPRGNPWTMTPFRRMICSPRLAGLRKHRGEVAGTAVWPPILTVKERDALVRFFEDRKPLRAAGTPARAGEHLLSGLLWCGGPGCDKKLSGNGYSGSYVCRSTETANGCGRISVSVEALDRHIREAIIGTVCGPDWPDRLRARMADDRDVQEAQRALDEDRAQLEELGRLYSSRRIRVEEWLAARDPIAARIERAERIVRARMPGDLKVLIDLPTAESKLREAWESWSLDRRRRVVRAMFVKLAVKPAARRGGGFDEKRADPVWRV